MTPEFCPRGFWAHREPTGGAVEVLLLTDRGDKVWECLVRPGKKVRPRRLSLGMDCSPLKSWRTLEGGTV